MDYGEEHTVWMAMGSIPDGSVLPELDPGRDSHIYCQNAASFGKDLEQLPHLNEFGTYRPDPCQPLPWQEIKPWQEDETIAKYVQDQDNKSDQK
jgi:hypothetical protein